MPKNGAKKEPGKATLAGVKREMAKPRVANSASKKYIRFALKRKRSSIRLYLPKPEPVQS
jgi:hypothetical protein